MLAIKEDVITLLENGLEVDLERLGRTYFNYYWLRDNCSTSFDSTTRERVFDIFHEKDAPIPSAAHVQDGALEITWAADGHQSRYDLDWLADYGQGKQRVDPADLPRKPWFSDHYDNIPRFSQPALMADKEVLKSWIEAMLVEGLAMITDMPDTNEALTETAELIGFIRPTFFGSFFDVKTHIKPTNLAFTAAALEMHTDTPAEEVAPGVQFLHCRANSVEGGQNLFLDGVAVANALRAEFPEDFQILADVDIPFYNEHDAYDMRSRQRVIELDQHGEVSGVTISQHMADVFDLPQDVMDSYYPAFCRFGRMLQDDKYLMRFRMNAGECFVFDNHRIVHGREAYTATSGDRYLRGTYTDRAEMRGVYRALVSEGRFK
jgi:gamma-butyrobetaine dioxygenase